MKTTQHSKCQPGAVAPGRGQHAHSPVRRPQLSGDALGVQDPRLTAPLLHDRGAAVLAAPRVLHIDGDAAAALLINSLLASEASVSSVDSLEQARVLLASESFALVVLDPAMLQGDPAVLLRLMGKARLLIYSRELPDWPVGRNAYLAKPATTARQLWSAVAGLLGISYFTHAGD